MMNTMEQQSASSPNESECLRCSTYLIPFSSGCLRKIELNVERSILYYLNKLILNFRNIKYSRSVLKKLILNFCNIIYYKNVEYEEKVRSILYYEL